MKVNVNPAKGMRDFLPEEVRLRRHLEATISETYERQGFSRIETPMVENIDMLVKSEGGENLQLIYKVLKRRDKLCLDTAILTESDLVDLGLRYDLTLPLSRFYANNMAKLPTPFKSLQIGTVFRAERQQRGRYRAFTQCDVDVIGDESPFAECEVVLATAKALLAVGIQNFRVRISDRRILAAVASHVGIPEVRLGEIAVALDKADKIGWPAVQEELLKLGLAAAATSSLLRVLRGLTIDDLSAVGVPTDVVSALQMVAGAITACAADNYQVVFSPTLMRGMGYYTGMVFEIEESTLGLSLAGGGRYDRMIGQWLGQNVPAVGFSIGFERVALLLQERGEIPPRLGRSLAYLYCAETSNPLEVLLGAEKLRSNGDRVSVLPLQKKLGKQLKNLEAAGYEGYFLAPMQKTVWFKEGR